MALGDFITGIVKKIRIGDIKNNRIDSEAVMSKLGANINALIDANLDVFSFAMNGYFRETSISASIDGVLRIDSDYEVVTYHLSVDEAGISGNTSFNIGVYDADNVFIDDLFSTDVQIGAGAKSGVVVGQEIITTGNVEIKENTGALVVNVGVLNGGVSLLKGYKLRAKLNSNAKDAKTMRFNLSLRRI